MSPSEARLSAATRPNDLEAFWMPFTANRAFKKAPRLIARREGHALLHRRRPRRARRHRRPVVLQCRPQPRPDRRGDPAPGGGARLRAGIPDRPSARVRTREPRRGARARRSRPRVLLQFRLRGGRHRLEDRARLSQRARRRRAHPPHRPRARLSRRRLRRHFGRRHRQQPQVFGTLLAGVDHLPHTYNRDTRPSPAASPNGARIWPTSSSVSSPCTMPRPSPPSSSSRWRARPACCRRPRAISQRLRAICDKYGILLIFDEVITGFGRLGFAFAAERYGVVPDMIDVRQRRHVGHRADGRRDRARADLRRLHARTGTRHRVVPRLYLFGPSAGLRRRACDARRLPRGKTVRARARLSRDVRPTPR